VSNRSVAPVNARLVVAAIVQAVIKVDPALFTADCRHSFILDQPGRRDRQPGDENRQHQNLPH
jgi:hypothetical protein